MDKGMSNTDLPFLSLSWTGHGRNPLLSFFEGGGPTSGLHINKISLAGLAINTHYVGCSPILLEWIQRANSWVLQTTRRPQPDGWRLKPEFVIASRHFTNNWWLVGLRERVTTEPVKTLERIHQFCSKGTWLLVYFIFTIRMMARFKNFKSSRCWLRDQKKSLAISHFHDLKSPTYYLETDIYSKALWLSLSVNVKCHAFLEQLRFCQNAKRWEVW